VPPSRKPFLESLHAIDLRLLGGAMLILTGIASSLLARRFGAPLLLVFLVLGVVLVVGACIVLINTGVDALRSALDPRLRQ